MKIEKMSNEQLQNKKDRLITEYHKHRNKMESYKYMIEELNTEQVDRLIKRLRTKITKKGV